MIKEQIRQYIEKEKLFTHNDKILVALSGGADSVALLRILLSLGYSCEAGHCNFHLRGKESDRDESFVRELCEKLDVPLHLVHFETEKFARKSKVSIEMAARELRYEWFNELKETNKVSVIAIAHHQDDSVETILLNLIRGTGINGLLGIRPKNGSIVRPLLCITRHEVIEYLHHIGQNYVTDSTNLQNEYTRNKIRLEILPLMQQINSSVGKSILDTAKHLNEAAHIYNQSIDKGRLNVLTPNGIYIEALLREPSPQALLFEILYPLGFNSAQIDDIFNSLSAQPGKVFTSSKKCRVIKDRDFLLIENQTEYKNETPPFELIFEEKPYTPSFVIPKEKDIACFDADKLKAPFDIRKWEKGDSFIPFGMTGKKLVSNYLTDRKLSLLQKENQWVLCSHGKIAWVIGERTDNRFRIDEHTKKILLVRLNQQSTKSKPVIP